MSEKLDKALANNIVAVTFKKTNGDIRVMICTKAADIIPPKMQNFEETNDPAVLTSSKKLVLNVTSRHHNPNVCAVWDLEKEAWRSFRYDSVLSWETHKEI